MISKTNRILTKSFQKNCIRSVGETKDLWLCQSTFIPFSNKDYYPENYEAQIRSKLQELEDQGFEFYTVVLNSKKYEIITEDAKFDKFYEFEYIPCKVKDLYIANPEKLANYLVIGFNEDLIGNESFLQTLAGLSFMNHPIAGWGFIPPKTINISDWLGMGIDRSQITLLTATEASYSLNLILNPSKIYMPDNNNNIFIANNNPYCLITEFD